MGVPDGLRTALADRYRLDRELGAGGMATVYLARDVRHDRDVAIKVLRPDLAKALGAAPFNLALVYLGLGDHARTLDYLSRRTRPARSSWSGSRSIGSTTRCGRSRASSR